MQILLPYELTDDEPIQLYFLSLEPLNIKQMIKLNSHSSLEYELSEGESKMFLHKIDLT